MSVLAAVSTQFILMLEALGARARRPLLAPRALHGRRGGALRARRASSRTRPARASSSSTARTRPARSRARRSRDPRDVRLRTAGRVIPEMQVRLFDDDGRDVTASGRGQPGCRGPLTSRGYWNDAAANRELYTPDGWMLTGDVAEIDAAGVLRVVGPQGRLHHPRRQERERGRGRGGGGVAPGRGARRGGRDARPGLRRARLRLRRAARRARGSRSPSSPRTCERRASRRSSLPERLVVLPELPRASGGKIAKGALREDIAARAARATARRATDERPTSRATT